MAESTRSQCPNCKAVFNPCDSSLPPFSPSLASDDILETNNPPLESQIPFLQDFVSKGRARMALLNAKIALLQSSLDELLEERSVLETNIGKHEGGLSPLRHLPTEILSLIFALTLPPHEPSWDASAPWTISAVCARWRATVVSQPCFWNSIYYIHDDQSATSFRLETQLRRSGQLPLIIKFSLKFGSDLTSRDSNALQLICKHAGRWEIVSLLGPEELYTRIRRSLMDRLALLRELKIEMLHFTDEVPSLDMFEDAPLLHRVFVNKSLWAYPVAMALPWLQLLQYGGCNTWAGHLHTLRSATNLVDCSLEIENLSVVSQVQTPILVPHLLRLSLSNSAFLACLATPALLELYCEYAAPVLPFLRRQSCKLQKLVLLEASVPADVADLTHMVEAVPTITDLAVLFPLPTEFPGTWVEHIWGILAKDPLEIQNLFMQVIESRWQGGRLKSVKVKSAEFAPGIRDRMRLLESQGMESMEAMSSLTLHSLDRVIIVRAGEEDEMRNTRVTYAACRVATELNENPRIILPRQLAVRLNVPQIALRNYGVPDFDVRGFQLKWLLTAAFKIQSSLFISRPVTKIVPWTSATQCLSVGADGVKNLKSLVTACDRNQTESEMALSISNNPQSRISTAIEAELLLFKLK
ncbi:hypothetical protein B0H13DRAFT_2435113 [Mycena leptocephala]|nr:hypothetical protein B0H13DRAFT_2435113 [Mycena leptocephala]